MKRLQGSREAFRSRSPIICKNSDRDRCRVRTIHRERIEKAVLDAVPEKSLARLNRVYKALGDPTRLKIAIALTGGEMCVCDLAAFLRISESAVSHQLRILKDANLVKNRRDGQVLYYSLDDDHVLNVLRLGLEHIEESVFIPTSRDDAGV